jgi:hypothetical protein
MAVPWMKIIKNAAAVTAGGAQLAQGLRQRKKADAMLPTPEDRLSRGYLNMIQGRRRALQTGTANNTDRASVRQLMKSMGNAGFQAGGQVNTGVLSQLLSQQAENMRTANAQEMGQLAQQEAAQVSEMAQRKSDIGMYRSQTMAARAEQNVSAGQDNLASGLTAMAAEGKSSGIKGIDRSAGGGGGSGGGGGGGMKGLKGKGKMLSGIIQKVGPMVKGMASSASDINLKENISHVGVENGFNIYEYNYKNDPSSRYRGVMAQEVAISRPDAVTVKDGHLAVYYDMIGLTMKKIK